MSALAIACFWCVLQVTLLSAVGIAITFVVARRYPVLATTSTNAVVVMVFIVTLLIPTKIPHWALPERSLAESPSQIIVRQGADSVSSEGQHDSDGWTISINTLATQTFSGFKHQQHVTLFNRALGWVQLLMTVLVLVGITRFVGAIRAVGKIRRNSRPVNDEHANQMLQKLTQSMVCPTSVQLHVSVEVHSPAVLGWLTPLIVLPSQWQTWEPHQLQAVLAHELAHVVRRDFFWRVLATFTQAFHFYHPFTHWLLRRLTYSQELAADQLAAATLGSRAAYSKALSQLAIRQDDLLLRFRAEPILLPTLRSHLIRRIEMLRVMECVEHGGLQRAIRVAVFCLSWTLSEIDELEYSSPPGVHDVQPQAVFP